MTSCEALEYPEAPSFEFHIFICQNGRPLDSPLGSCGARGSEALLLHMKSRVKELGLENVRINKSGCLGQCAYGPVLVMYPEGRWFQVRTRDDIDLIIERIIMPALKPKNSISQLPC